MKTKDLTGQKFGRWTVTGPVEIRHTPRKRPYWFCRCQCGKEKFVLANTLVCGESKSCGCYLAEGLHAISHGKTKTREFRIYHAMRQRCLNQKSTSFHNYGGRGITICQRWLDSFENFLADMGAAPSAKFSIERKDNDQGYSPENCCWATRKEQADNRRPSPHCQYVEYKGQRKLLSEWSKELNLTGRTLYTRLRKGWSLERAMTTPKMKNQFKVHDAVALTE